VLLFPALGMAMGGVAALFAVLLGLSALPVLDLLHPQAGGVQGTAAARARRRGALPTLAATLAAVLCAGVALSLDRFDADHPVPTHLMYALDAGTGQARWLSHETKPQPWTDRYVDGTESVGVDFPALGDEELRTGPAEPATVPAPKLDVLADTTANGVRTLRLRLTPQRPVRLASLHVEAARAEVRSAVVAGRPVATERAGGGHWGFGLVFHAPPAEGVEITLELAPRVGGPVLMRAMDASDGLTGLPGFQPRPADVGVAGSHSSEMLAVARTYPV